MTDGEISDPLRSISLARDAAATMGARRLMELTLARAAEFAADNIFIASPDQVALNEADLSAGSVGPLAGVPFVVKDNIDALPYPTTGGSKALGDYCPKRDADGVRLLREQGAVVAGKVNLHEIAFGVTSINPSFGTVRNPFDPARVAGGSSGGTAAAVARGIVPFGLGTDTGGSIRIPAAYCGICGFRPSPGRYPATGQLILSPTRDVLGTMANTVADLQLLDTILSGEPNDPSIAKPLRIGVVKGAAISGFSADHDRAMSTIIDRLSAAGVTLIDVDFADGFALDARCGMPIALFETAEIWRDFVPKTFGMTLEAFTEVIVGADVRGIFRHVTSPGAVPRAVYDAAMQDRQALQAAYSAALTAQSLDALLMVAVPIPPPKADEHETTLVDGVTYQTFAATIRHVSPASVAGVPSLSIPGGLTSAGLPVGILLDGYAGGDRALLAVGAAIETVIGEDVRR